MGVTHVGLASSDKSYGHEPEQTLGATPTNILPSAIRGVLRVVIQVLDNDIVFRDDGGDPSATRGLIVSAGDIYVHEASFETMRDFRAVALSGTARVRVAYYGI